MDENYIHFRNRCPICKSNNLEYYSIEPENEIIIQPVECKSCKKEFQIFTIPTWYIRK